MRIDKIEPILPQNLRDSFPKKPIPDEIKKCNYSSIFINQTPSVTNPDSFLTQSARIKIESYSNSSLLNKFHTKEDRDRGNIRKAARLIAQGTRDAGSLFSRIPDEIGVKIAAMCGDGSLNKISAEQVATKNFGKPTIKPK